MEKKKLSRGKEFLFAKDNRVGAFFEWRYIEKTILTTRV